MPAEGLDWLPKPELLTDDEVVRLIRIGVERLGITEIRFTGGEPLLRRGLAGIVARTAALRPRPEISLTTNGIGLDRLAGPLHAAGLDRINVSLDTLRPETFRRARPARPARTTCWPASSAAAATGLAPVKVNTVLMRGMNDDEAVPLARFCLEHGYQLRFIEQMPLDAQHGWRRDNMVTADEILAALSAGVLADARRPGGPRVGPGRGVPGRRRSGPDRRDRLGDQAVLRFLRPGPAHRRRPGPQLPVRDHRERPARRRCGPARAMPRSPSSGAGRSRPSCPVTASTIPASCSPPGRCRPSAASRASSVTPSRVRQSRTPAKGLPSRS